MSDKNKPTGADQKRGTGSVRSPIDPKSIALPLVPSKMLIPEPEKTKKNSISEKKQDKK